MYNWNDGFPYKRLDPKFGSPDELVQQLKVCKIYDDVGDFSVYRRSKIGTPSFLDKPLCLIDAGSDEYELNKLTDYYTEYARVRARYGNLLSPYDYYFRNKHRIRGGIYDQREYLYKNVKEATQFKITTTIYIIDYFDCKKMLDFSAGWGDRLFGAVIRDIKYTGIDPNTDLQSGHTEIINTFGNRNKQIIYYDYAEKFDFSILDNDYDVCFTSPPFFNVEIYSQQIQLTPNYVLWMRNFLFDVIVKAWSKIRPHGHMCLHLGDTKQHSIIEPALLFILTNIPDSQYIGYFGVKGRNTVGIYVFHKMTSIISRQRESEIFQRYYPELF